MARIKPFVGLRPRQDMAEKVAAPPYDVLDSDEAREMAAGNPWSILHCSKPEIDLDPSVDLYDDRVYARGAENLRKMMENGVLRQDDTSTFYFYRQIMAGHSQTGLVACASIEDYENDVIKKHEFTRKDKELDRIRHIEAQNAQIGPVFLAYRDVEEMAGITRMVCSAAPECDFTSADGVRHTFWVVRDQHLVERIVGVFSGIPYLYVADGHHRSAAGTLIGQKRRASNPNHTGREEYNYFLSVIFPKSNLQIMPYNRVVADLAGLTQEEFLSRISGKFRIYSDPDPTPPAVKNFSMYMSGKWYGLEALPDSFQAADPVESLDASILQRNLLAPILGIDDPRTSKRINFVGGIRGTQELERLVDSGRYAVAFSLHAVTMDQLLDVADNGSVMPPKSTWFEPKLRSGLVIHLL